MKSNTSNFAGSRSGRATKLRISSRRMRFVFLVRIVHCVRLNQNLRWHRMTEAPKEMENLSHKSLSVPLLRGVTGLTSTRTTASADLLITWHPAKGGEKGSPPIIPASSRETGKVSRKYLLVHASVPRLGQPPTGSAVGIVIPRWLAGDMTLKQGECWRRAGKGIKLFWCLN